MKLDNNLVDVDHYIASIKKDIESNKNPNYFGYVDVIRSLYDALGEKSKKIFLLRDSFEERYIEVLRKKGNLRVFLEGELDFIEIQGKKVNKEIQEGYLKKAKKVSEESQSYKVRYRRHPAVHEDAALEIASLVGGVYDFLTDFWENILHSFRGTSASFRLMDLERSIDDIYNKDEKMLPKAVFRYDEALRGGEALAPERLKASQIIFRVYGFWLAQLFQLLKRSCEENTSLLEGRDMVRVEEALARLKNIIDDFRLDPFGR